MCLVRRAHWNADARRRAAIGVDNEVDRRAAEPAGVGVDGKVLQPDAGVEEFWLMPAHHHRPCDPVGHIDGPIDVAVAGRVFRGNREHLASRRGHQLPELQVADPCVEGRAEQAVVVDQRLDRLGRRVGRRLQRRVEEPRPRFLRRCVDAAAGGWRTGG